MKIAFVFLALSAIPALAQTAPVTSWAVGTKYVRHCFDGGKQVALQLNADGAWECNGKSVVTDKPKYTVPKTCFEVAPSARSCSIELANDHWKYDVILDNGQHLHVTIPD